MTFPPIHTADKHTYSCQLLSIGNKYVIDGTLSAGVPPHLHTKATEPEQRETCKFFII